MIAGDDILLSLQVKAASMLISTLIHAHTLISSMNHATVIHIMMTIASTMMMIVIMSVIHAMVSSTS